MVSVGKRILAQAYVGKRTITRIHKGSTLVWANGKKYARTIISAAMQVYGTAAKGGKAARFTASAVLQVTGAVIKGTGVTVSAAMHNALSLTVAAVAKAVKSAKAALSGALSVSAVGRAVKPHAAAGTVTAKSAVSLPGGRTSKKPMGASVGAKTGFFGNGASYYIHDVVLVPIAIKTSTVAAALRGTVKAIKAVHGAALTATAAGASRQVTPTKAAVLLGALKTAITAMRSGRGASAVAGATAAIAVAAGKSTVGMAYAHAAALTEDLAANNATAHGAGTYAHAVEILADAQASDSLLAYTGTHTISLTATAQVSGWELPVYDADTQDLSVTQVWLAQQSGDIINIT